jgi:tripartite-type tricarboxylate transporter receptor subunit TctC
MPALPRRTLLAALALPAFAFVLALPSVTRAQDWPNRPITMVVAYAAGGPVDTIARLFGQRLSEVLGQQVVIENIGGAGGMVGADRVAKATPDGYRFLFGGLANLAQNQTLYKRPLYNAATDFTPVGLITDSPRVLIARKDFPASSLAEFIAYAKANHAKLQYGSPGGGSGGHVCSILLDGVIGARVTHVPYRGAGPAMQDLIGGRLDYMCEQISTAFPQIEAGAVKGIAILGPERVSVLPNMISAKEGGLGDFDCGAWSAIVAPLNTPDAIVRRLNKAASEAVDTPAVKTRLAEVGVTVVAPERRSPEYLAKFIPAEIEKWAGPIKASGVSGD